MEYEKVMINLPKDLKERLEDVAAHFGQGQRGAVARQCVAHCLPMIEKALREGKRSRVMGAALYKKKLKESVKSKN